MMPPGAIWNSPCYQEGLTPKCVALGNSGTLVFTDIEGSNTFARTLSSADHTPTTPVSQSAASYSRHGNVVASADQDDARVSLAYVQSSAGSNASIVLSKYSFGSAAGNWTYSMPFTVPNVETALLGVGVSRDGQTIVATAYRRAQLKQAIAVFSPASSTPVLYAEVPEYYEPIGIELSADGTTLFVLSPTSTFLFSTVTGALVYSMDNFQLPWRALAISGDGTTFAKSFSDHHVEIYRKQSSGYSLFGTFASTSTGQCDAAALSDDGRTLALAFEDSIYPSQTVRSFLIDLSGSQPQVRFNASIESSGPYWNYPKGVAISAVGDVYVVGVTGNQDGTTAQVVAYQRDAASGTWANVLQAHVSGSVNGLDISADGRVIAVANLRGHAQAPLGGAEINLLQIEPKDLELSSVPHSGSQAEVRYSPAHPIAPGSWVVLLESPALNATPFNIPGVGQLYLDRLTTHSAGSASIDNSGLATFHLNLPAGSTAIGTTNYLQALCASPRTLSQDWVAVTVVP